MTKDEYIEHEVKLRLHEHKFKTLEKTGEDIKESLYRLENKLDSRFTLLIGLIVSGWILPVVLHFLKLV